MFKATRTARNKSTAQVSKPVRLLLVLSIVLLLVGASVFLYRLMKNEAGTLGSDDGQEIKTVTWAITDIPHKPFTSDGTFYSDTSDQATALFYKNPDGTVETVVDGVFNQDIYIAQSNPQYAVAIKNIEGDSGDGSQYGRRIYFADTTEDRLFYSADPYSQTWEIKGIGWLGDSFVYYARNYDSATSTNTTQLHAFNIKSKQDTQLAQVGERDENSYNHFTPQVLEAAILDKEIVYIMSRQTFYKSTVTSREGEHAYAVAIDPSGSPKKVLAKTNSLTEIAFRACKAKHSPCIELQSYREGEYGGAGSGAVFREYDGKKLVDIDSSLILNK